MSELTYQLVFWERPAFWVRCQNVHLTSFLHAKNKMNVCSTFRTVLWHFFEQCFSSSACFLADWVCQARLRLWMSAHFKSLVRFWQKQKQQNFWWKVYSIERRDFWLDKSWNRLSSKGSNGQHQYTETQTSVARNACPYLLIEYQRASRIIPSP